MVILAVLFLWFVSPAYAANKTLSAREYKEEVGHCATQALKAVTVSMQESCTKFSQISDATCFSAVTQFQLFCIEQVENLLEDDSFWHKARRSVIVNESPLIIEAYKKVVTGCAAQEKKIDQIADVCKQAIDQIISCIKKIQASV
jgi:hypothetical protein